MPRSSPGWRGSTSFTSTSSSSSSSFSSTSSSSFIASSPAHHRLHHQRSSAQTHTTTLRLKRWLSTHFLSRLIDTPLSRSNNKGYYNPGNKTKSSTTYSQSKPSSRTMLPGHQNQSRRQRRSHGHWRGEEDHERQDQNLERDHSLTTHQDLRFVGFDYDYEYERYMYEAEGQRRHQQQHHRNPNPNEPEIYDEDQDGAEEEDIVLSDSYAAYCRAFTSSPTSHFGPIPVLPLPRFQSSEEAEGLGSEFGLWEGNRDQIQDHKQTQTQNQNLNQDLNQSQTFDQKQGQDQKQGSPQLNSPDTNRDLDPAQDASQIRFLPVGAHGYHPASWVAPNPNPPSPPPGILTPARYEKFQQRRMSEIPERDKKRKQGRWWCIPIRASWWPWPRRHREKES